MYKKKRVTAIILAGGSGSRMGTAENKVYLPLGGRPAILYGVETFAGHPYVDEIVFVVREEERAEAEALLWRAAVPKTRRFVVGGSSRRESVWNALVDVESEIVLVHDGARPFVSAEGITACVEALDRYEGVILARPMEAPIYKVSRKQKAPVQLQDTLYAAQTPQGFRTKTLRLCHERHRDNQGITDDSSLLELEGYQVGIVAGEAWNMKLTTPLDIAIAEAYLSEKNKFPG